MSGDGEPFPVSFEPVAKARLGRGKYRAVEVDAVVKVMATDIPMSGASTHAELIHVPTFKPPIQYRLTVWETLPQLDNLVIGSASALFAFPADEEAGRVRIEDADGTHDVAIEKPARAMSLAAAGPTAHPIYEGMGRSLEEAVQNALKSAPRPPGADMLSTLTVVAWGYTSGGIAGFSDYWVKGRID